MYFIALTCRTNAFENQTVAADFISGFFRDLVIQKSLVWVGGVYYFFAYDAKHMIVQIGAQDGQTPGTSVSTVMYPPFSKQWRQPVQSHVFCDRSKETVLVSDLHLPGKCFP